MKKVLSLFAALLITANVYADPLSHCDKMVPFGYPVAKARVDSTKLCRIAYMVDHDNTKKVPIYSAEWLLRENLGTKNKRVNAFKPDPDLEKQPRAELSDYDQRYDRGHMTPFEDARYNSAAALQTFYLSNIVPQNLHLNRGVWRAIENRTRSYAYKSEYGVYVITGTVFNGDYRTIGNGVGIPSSVYKIIIDRAAMQGVGYLVPNKAPTKGIKPETFKVTIAEVERVTGINFTPALSDQSFKQTIGERFR